VEEAVRKAIGEKVRGVKRVKFRFIPVENDELTFQEEFITQDMEASPESQEQDHDHDHSDGHDHGHGHGKTTNGSASGSHSHDDASRKRR
jgi:hypothetical protein